MNKKISLALSAGLFLLGCGGKTYYESADKSKNETEREHMECEYEAEKATASVVDSDERRERIDSLVDKCMRLKGYQPE
ncbi:hypothetical protein [Desulfolutivibrio sp.]|uniref:hypothetical protein n=1 Tax=Desulfolutivibrio sp. TaxID=2773296 RepID=UPI002F96487A